jgi:hypothetical protein
VTRFTIIGTSNFNGLNRYRSEGPNAMAPVLEQRQTLGFNAFRSPLIGDCKPDESLYAVIPEYMAFCASFGFYVEVTAFTGPYVYFPNQDTMIAHWERLDRELDGITNLLDLEAVNEGDNGPNLGVPLDRLRRPAGKIASHGSAVQDAPPMLPVWDVAQHRPGSSEWWRKVGHNAMADVADVYNVPAFCNETPRMPDNDDNPNHAYDAAAGAALLCAGSFFHSPSGKNATLFGGTELMLAQRWTRGALSVPLEFQSGRYSRPEPNPPGVIRRYRRTLNDGRFHEVAIRA